jgi:hypothetical protein
MMMVGIDLAMHSSIMLVAFVSPQQGRMMSRRSTSSTSSSGQNGGDIFYFRLVMSIDECNAVGALLILANMVTPARAHRCW